MENTVYLTENEGITVFFSKKNHGGFSNAHSIFPSVTKIRNRQVANTCKQNPAAIFISHEAKWGWSERL